MRIKADRRKIVKQIKDQAAKAKKGRVTLYVNIALYRAFHAACEKEGVPASAIVERFMESFLER